MYVRTLRRTLSGHCGHSNRAATGQQPGSSNRAATGQQPGSNRTAAPLRHINWKTLAFAAIFNIFMHAFFAALKSG
jgi:hypothetical protein